ncbi:hypothetical protein [Streptomyces lydicus]|uniref:hypothetical protein n=1 Tax=Streptomyces lydicus TaxID=47763 RepID=UPI0037AE5798
MVTPVTPDEANEAIRAFMVAPVRRGRPLWPEEQAEYEELLDAWAAAVRDGSHVSPSRYALNGS